MYTLKYRTFDQLLEDVSIDFGAYSLEGMIEPQQLIKVALRVNYDLGLRIHQQKEVLLDIEKNKAKLPSDFYILNFAYQCGSYEVKEWVPSGTHIEEKIIAPAADCVATPSTTSTSGGDELYQCQPEGTCLTQCGEYYQLIHKDKYETKIYKTFGSLPIKAGSSLDRSCPNSCNRNTPNAAEIVSGFLKTPFETGQVYLNYQGAMEDEDGQLMVLDHPVINEYYEYALKQRILESMLFAGEEVTQKMNLIEQRLRAARNNALSIVNTPNFAELKKIWEVNRKAQYHKYVDMFKSYPVVQ